MLERMKARLVEIEQAIVNTQQSLYILQGHKNEVVHQIAELTKLEEAKAQPEEKSEEPIETQVEVPVE